MIHDGKQLDVVDLYDGAAAQVIVFAPDYTPATDHQVVDDISGTILGRADVTLSATLTEGEVWVTFDDTTVDIDGADIVGGWVLARDSGDDAVDRLLSSFSDPGGFPPDPYPIVLTDAAVIDERPPE